MKVTIANSSDFGGPTNPSGIWSPAYLAFKMAVDRNDSPDNVLQALFDWLSTKKISAQQVEKVLQLPTMDEAYTALLELVGAGLTVKPLPPAVQVTLRKAIQRLAEKYVSRESQDLDQRRARLNAIQTRFSGGATAESLVRDLLADPHE